MKLLVQEKIQTLFRVALVDLEVLHLVSGVGQVVVIASLSRIMARICFIMVNHRVPCERITFLLFQAIANRFRNLLVFLMINLRCVAGVSCGCGVN